VAAGLDASARACAIDEDVAHRARRVGEELAGFVELEIAARADLEVQLVDQVGRIERPASAAEFAMRHRLEAWIDFAEPRLRVVPCCGWGSGVDILHWRAPCAPF